MPRVLTPGRRRVLAGLAFGLSVLALPATAQQPGGPPPDRADRAPLTERDALAFALARPPFVEVLAQRLVVAESFVAEAATFPNPHFDVERDRVRLAGGTETETKYRIGQTLDVSGRRGLRRDAAERRVDAARSDSTIRRVEVAAETRLTFAQGLFRVSLRDALDEWRRRLDTTATVLEQLRRAGEVSGYDRMRLEQERLSARARLDAAAADYARAFEQLLALTGAAAEAQRPHSLARPLLPDPVPPRTEAEAALARRGDVRSLEERAQALDREREAARRGWIPDVTVTVGVKDVSLPGDSGSGPIVGVAIPLPVFDRREPAARRADAEAKLLRAERDLLVARASGELRGLWQQAAALRDAAVAFRADAAASARELARIAETAYRGGETGILQLLDAYRTVLESETTALDLEHRAREARIELDRALGVVPHE